MEILEKLGIAKWGDSFPEQCAALESGKILFAPDLPFELTQAERRFLSPTVLDGKSKNLSFRPAAGALQGTGATGAERAELLAMLRRYHEKACTLMNALCPSYRGKLKPGFASFRPAEIAGRASSCRKDDSRLHVDAFPSRPLQGLRILRVFTNVNSTAPRQWRVGESFERVARTFLPRIGRPFPGSSWLLYRLKIVKGLRTPYDRLMLGIHDGMKADLRYQANCEQTTLAVPAGATWACFTDSVSHAAMSGQFCFEQTFYLPVDAMEDPARSPLRILERLTGRVLT
ncbi:MAG: Kdo hydroxylase family protein [Bryobacteraceae bacterium]